MENKDKLKKLEELNKEIDSILAKMAKDLYSVSEVKDTSDEICESITGIIGSREFVEKFKALEEHTKSLSDKEVVDNIVTAVGALLTAYRGRIGKYLFVLSPEKDIYKGGLNITSNCKNIAELEEYSGIISSIIAEHAEN